MGAVFAQVRMMEPLRDQVGHGCAIESDGSIWCWGYNGSGQLGEGFHPADSRVSQFPD